MSVSKNVIKTNVLYLVKFATILIAVDIVINFNGGKGYYTMGSLTAFGTAGFIFIQTCINLFLGVVALFKRKLNIKDYFISAIVNVLLFLPIMFFAGLLGEAIIAIF